MPQTTITVTCANGVISASPVDPTITTRGANVIQWEAGSGISSITGITGLPNPPFTTPQQNSNVWQSTDTNTANGNYPYTIQATCTGGTAGHHDPQITNEPG